jgi:hypothetical protein
MKIVFFFLVSSLGLFTQVKAAELLLNGVYHGTNVFVHNTKDAGNEFCITEIYVNNRKIDFVPSATVEINLSFLKVNDAVAIKIFHKDDCTPKVQNINAIKAKEQFQFVSIELAPDKMVWSTKGEKKFSQFFIETFKNNVWIVEKSINCKGQAHSNSYEVNLTATTEGKYRIKYLELNGKTTYSDEVMIKK